MLYLKAKGMHQILSDQCPYVATKCFDYLIIVSRSHHFEISIGLDWNDFKIEIGNKDPQIRPIIYILRIRRLAREDNPLPFHANHQTVCILEQVY
jgi:hypothetical protein